MNQRLRQMLQIRRRTLTDRETALEKKGFKLMMEAMHRPTVSLTAETEFLLMAISLQWLRLQKRWLQRLLQPRPKLRGLRIR